MLTVAYEDTTGEILPHELIFDGKPDPDCFSCVGTGTLDLDGKPGLPVPLDMRGTR